MFLMGMMLVIDSIHFTKKKGKEKKHNDTAYGQQDKNIFEMF